jgi:hypothetical protein
MTKRVHRHRAWSLVETLVVVAIVAVLFGITIAAVQKVRAAARETDSTNRIRQIGLANLNYAAHHDGLVPGVFHARFLNDEKDLAQIYDLLPYLDGFLDMSTFQKPSTHKDVPANWWLRFLLSPCDLSVAKLDPKRHGSYTPTSYAANLHAFQGMPKLAASFADGTSQTMAFVERYCFLVDPTSEHTFDLFEIGGGPAPFGLYGGSRRGSFADAGWGDVVPVTSGQPATSRASIPGKTFERSCIPLRTKCTYGIVQSPHANKLLVCYFDGHAAFLSASASETTFWGLVTRDGGEVVELN